MQTPTPEFTKAATCARMAGVPEPAIASAQAIDICALSTIEWLALILRLSEGRTTHTWAWSVLHSQLDGTI